MKPPRLPYAPLKGGKRFWQPTPEMRKLGFLPKPLGDEGPKAWQEAARLYQTWIAAKAEASKVTSYPPASFGAYYDRFRRTKAWAKKAPRTREDYERAWPRIEPVFARKTVNTISTEDCEVFFDEMDAALSPSERYRVIKILKILLDDARVRLKLPEASPASRLTNPQPKGRSAIWLGAEVEALAVKALASGYAGMSLAIQIAWDTLFAPVDVWTLRLDQIKQDGEGWYAERNRTKTDKGAFGSLSASTAAHLVAYIASLPPTLPPESPLIHQRNGQPYRSKDTFGDDFRAVRKLAFPGDTRQFMDIRRSGNVEADAAGADKETMGELLANGLANNAFLEDTYTPPTVTKAREVARQRLEGRERLKNEIQRRTSSN